MRETRDQDVYTRPTLIITSDDGRHDNLELKFEMLIHHFVAKYEREDNETVYRTEFV